jgi:hypothetical protein
MAEERRTRRGRVEEAAAGGWIVGVTPGGRLEWVLPEAPGDDSSVPSTPSAMAEAPLGAEIVSAEEQALIKANREKIAELRTRAYPSPDLHDVVADIMARTNPPTLSLAAAGWVLQATGLVPMPIFDSAVMAVNAVGFIGRELGHRLHAEQVGAETTNGAARLWRTHPGLTLSILTIVMSTVIDSIKNAMSADDTQLEDELDAFYPRWSRTDFEFDLRRYQR